MANPALWPFDRVDEDKRSHFRVSALSDNDPFGGGDVQDLVHVGFCQDLVGLNDEINPKKRINNPMLRTNKP